MRFALPHFLWLLLLAPALAVFFWWGLRKRQSLMAAFIPPRLLGSLTVGVSHKRARWRAATLVAAVVFFVLALARPQWGFAWEEVKVRGLDIVVAIDTSKSMLAEDIAPNRLARAKLAAVDLAQQARSDRLGLVAFAGSGFLQCPLTIDDAAFRQAVDSLTISTIPVGGSAIGEGIQAALPAYKEGDNHRVLVILSDGEDNAEGAVGAARKAAETGLKIYCIGVGTVEGERIPIKGPGGAVAHVLDESGNVVLSKLNEELLREVAAATEGGIYLPLRGARTMETLYQQVLAKLPKADNQEKLVKQYRERFHWPLALGMLLLVLEAFWPVRRAANSSGPVIQVARQTVPLALCVLALMAPAGAAAASSGKALRDYKAGNYEKSLREYEALLKQNPEDPRLQFNAGAAAYQNGQYEAAIKRFTEALAASDLELQQSAYYNRGNSQFRQGENQPDPKERSEDWKKAVRDYESALKLNPKDANATHNQQLVKKLLEELQQQQQQQQQNQDDSEKNEDQQQQDKQQQQQQQQQQHNQQQQQQQQPQQGEQDKQEQQSQESQQSEQQQQQQQESQPENEQKKEQQQAGQEKQEKPEDQTRDAAQSKKPDGEKQEKESQGEPGRMTPEQARRLLEAQREGEKMLPANTGRSGGERSRPLKDW